MCSAEELVPRSACEVTQSCPTLWDPMDYSLPGSSLHGILQARVLEWVEMVILKNAITRSSINATCSVNGFFQNRVELETEQRKYPWG